MKTADIVRTTGFKKSTVYDAVKRFKETGGSLDRPRSGRPATAVTPENVKKVRCRIYRNSERSMRKLAKDLKISEGSIRNIVHKKLKCYSYKINRAHFLTDAMKEKRKERARRMIRLISGARLQKVLFTDEKIFTIESLHNRQNRRQLLKKGQQSDFPGSVMVWAGICATGKTPLVFIERNVKINATSYQQRILREVLQPWALKHFGEEGFTLQQDWAPAHSAQTTIATCEELFPGFWGKDVWPPNSPDLNPMDYSVWSILEQKISGKRYNTVDTLKRALERSWDEITVEQCASIVGNFPKRLKKCIEADGGNFEHLSLNINFFVTFGYY
ncbi:Transposable element Tc3 transposase [Anthophora retusa]